MEGWGNGRTNRLKENGSLELVGSWIAYRVFNFFLLLLYYTIDHNNNGLANWCPHDKG